MRALIALLLLPVAGCPQTSGGVCDEDVECDTGEVCARGDHLCVAPNQVRMTRTEWTINGQPADAGNCGGRALYIQFQSTRVEDDFGFSPVPCENGVFTVDKLPIRYRRVEVGVERGSAFDNMSFDDAGNAFLDLTF